MEQTLPNFYVNVQKLMFGGYSAKDGRFEVYNDKFVFSRLLSKKDYYFNDIKHIERKKFLFVFNTFIITLSDDSRHRFVCKYLILQKRKREDLWEIVDELISKTY